MQSTPLKQFIEEVSYRYKASFGQKDQQLALELSNDLPSAKIDGSRMEQVIVNLLSNASKYSPANTCITLRATIENKGLLVEVIDHGIGISAEDQGKLFQPYQRVGKDTHKSKGLGLGLTVVKQIIETHGGRIWVSSAIEKGSTFGFWIPINQ